MRSGSSIKAAATLAMIFVLTTSAPAESVVNDQWGFTIDYPAGWNVAQSPIGPVYVEAVPAAPETQVNCKTTAVKVPATEKMSQEDINKDVANEEIWSEDFWRKAVYGRFNNVEFESHSVRAHPSGIRTPEAVASYDDTTVTPMVRAKTRSVAFITPGATFSVSCNAAAEKFERYRQDFAAIIDSFRMKRDIIASLSARRPGMLPVVRIDLRQTAASASAGVSVRRLGR